MAIADEQYFDWPLLPEAPSSLRAEIDGVRVDLSWQAHAGADGVLLERRAGMESKWEPIRKLPGRTTVYREQAPSARPLSYRVRAYSTAGVSAYSNIVRFE